MKQISLTQGQVALIDDWWLDKLSQWRWYALWDPTIQNFYAVRSDGKRPFRKGIKMHCYIMNTPDDMVCDHVNHDTLNNQEHNLRNVTRSQSNMNRRVQTNNHLGIKNIRKIHKGYEVRIFVDGDNVFYQYCHTLEEAIAIRDEALKQYHGEYANTEI